jgi:hypothetical protein
MTFTAQDISRDIEELREIACRYSVTPILNESLDGGAYAYLPLRYDLEKTLRRSFVGRAKIKTGAAQGNGPRLEIFFRGHHFFETSPEVEVLLEKIRELELENAYLKDLIHSASPPIGW